MREDALDLYGFISRTEKELFLLLLSVNGIGPKGALAVLSGMSPPALVGAILGGDHGSLQKIPGVGKKTAERIVLELSDVLKKRPDLMAHAPAPGAVAPKARARVAEPAVEFAMQAFVDAREALVQLGFREGDVLAVLRRLEAEEGIVENAAATGDVLRTELNRLAAKHPSVGSYRNIGLFGIMELVRSHNPWTPLTAFNATSDEMKAVQKSLREQGLFTMYQWNGIHTNPPLCVTEEQLAEGFAMIDRALEIADEAVV